MEKNKSPLKNRQFKLNFNFNFKLFDDEQGAVPSGNITYIIAFIIPLIIFTVLYYLRDIFPFGENCYLRSDMYHQYAPFFSELWDKLRNGGSLTYSWDIGMGTNFTSLYAYYLASPSNWIIALFPQKHIIEVMNAIIILKLAGSSLTICYYLSKHFNTKKCSIALFGTFYALSAYIAAYSWNIMWLDCILLLPLIMLGLERLVKENKCFLYCISLGLCIYTNYYISIMVCLSIIIYFFVLIFAYDGNKSPIIYLKKFFNWGLYSLLAGGLAACLLLPELYTFSLSASSSITFPKTLTNYFSVMEMLVRHLINVPVHMGLDHYPNIYCGVAIFLLIPLYIMNKKINAREKIGKCVILLIFLLAYNLNIPNFIWHGLHYPNSLPCRQAFIYIFFLITMCYEAFHYIKDLNAFGKRSLAGATCFALGFLVLAENMFLDSETYDFKIFYISGAFILAYALLLYLLREGKIGKQVLLFLAFTVTIIECTVNMEKTGIGTTSRTSYMLDYNAVKSATDTVEKIDTSFYRIDKIYGARTKNDGAWHNYHSISTFSSTSSAGIASLYDLLGLVNSTNAYSYDGSTLVTNALFSVKYLISNKHLQESDFLTYYTGGDGEFIYINNYTLPIGYLVSDNFNSEWDPDIIYNGIENQNSMIQAMTGVTNVFALDSTSGAEQEALFKPKKAGHMYMYIANTGLDMVNVSITRETTQALNFSNLKSNGHVLDIGYVTPNDTISVYGEAALNMYAYTLDSDAFMKAYNLLNDDGALDITKWSDTKIEGTVTADDYSTLVLSIPYDEGWSVYIDGKKTHTYAIQNALTAVNVDTGSHTIKISYTPVNLIKGCIITILCIIILIAIYIFKKYCSNGKINPSKLPVLLQNIINENDLVIGSGSNTHATVNKQTTTGKKGSANDSIETLTDEMNDFDNIEIEDDIDDSDLTDNGGN